LREAVGQRVGESKSITSCTCRAALRSVESPRFVRAWRTYAYACMRMYVLLLKLKLRRKRSQSSSSVMCVARVRCVDRFVVCVCVEIRENESTRRKNTRYANYRGTAAARARARRARRGRAPYYMALRLRSHGERARCGAARERVRCGASCAAGSLDRFGWFVCEIQVGSKRKRAPKESTHTHR